MREIKRFNMGSRHFFEDMEDYTPKDNDILVIMEDWKLPKTNVLNIKDKKGNDIFFYKNMNKEDFIKDTLSSNVPMRCGKFLIKEFCEYIGFTIEDLKKLDVMFQNMDKKHSYEKKIYKSFIKNNKFELTTEQLQECYNQYKKERI